MKWLTENFMIIVLYVFIIYMFLKMIFQIYKTLKKEEEKNITNNIPECEPLLVPCFIDYNSINNSVIKATFIDLCKKGYIELLPIINDNDEIKDYELMKKGVPNFNEKEYEDNLYNEDFKSSDISLSYIYILNKYIFKGKSKILYTDFEKEVKNINLNEDQLYKKITTIELNYLEEKLEGNDSNEKERKLVQNINGFRTFLKKYDFIKKSEDEDINIWGKYYTYAIVYNLEDLSIEQINYLIVMDYFNKK